MKVSVFRKAHFNAAHRLENKSWSDEQNREYFGKCNLPNYHGHNYVLEVKITGEIDSETGYVMDLGILNKLIETHITSVFDHRNLNLDVQEFNQLNPTAENIAVVIYQKLRPLISDQHELGLRLYETERNFVEINDPLK